MRTRIRRHPTRSQTENREDTPRSVWTALAKSLPAIAGSLGILWLYASCQTAKQPDWNPLTLQAMDFELMTFPKESLLTDINVEWILRFADQFRYGEGRFPATYEELVSSEYFPSPSALTNPYTHRPVKSSDRPAMGDIKWRVEPYKEPDGTPGEFLRIHYFLVRKKGGIPMERMSGTANRARSKASPYMEEELQWVASLSPRERRTFWICRAMDMEMGSDVFRFLADRAPSTFREFQSLLGWRYHDRLFPNSFKPRPMREVPESRPSPGDFSYRVASEEPEITCYGENGRIIFPSYRARQKA